MTDPDTHRPALLVLTHDDMLAARWSALADEWQVDRGRRLADLDQWRPRAVARTVLLDAALPGLPDWSDPDWPTRWAGASALVTLGSPGDAAGTEVLNAGAGGFCHVYAPVATVRQALRVIAAGELWVGRALLTRLLLLIDQRLPAPPEGTPDWATGLTDRERQVAAQAALGASNDAIAADLGIAPRTVKAHLSAAFEKLQVPDRLQLALRVHGIR